ncbi:MAG: aminopeptidase P family protein [Chlamydiae bacterium]|nr:aminopeptidase P family protein [Chlamydiota bacterium]
MSYLARIKNVQKYLLQNNLDVLIFEEPISILYLTGMQLSLGKLLISKKVASLFVDHRYFQAAKEKCDSNVEELLNKNIATFIKKSSAKTLGFDSRFTTYFSYENLQSFLKKEGLKLKLVPIFYPLKNLRLIKDKEEIILMKKSAELNYKGFKHISSILKEGMSEKEIAMEFEFFCRKNGAEGLSFSTIVCFEENAAMPHHRPTDAKLKKNSLILIDSGVLLNNYASDMTRVLFFGKADPKLKKYYDIVKEAHNAALALCKPGVALKELDLAARKVLKREKVEKYFVHTLGHGIGLEVHEFPRIKYDHEDKDFLLQENMVFTIEPGIYIPKLGGVRYENMILITKNGYENLYEPFEKKYR